MKKILWLAIVAIVMAVVMILSGKMVIAGETSEEVGKNREEKGNQEKETEKDGIKEMVVKQTKVLQILLLHNQRMSQALDKVLYELEKDENYYKECKEVKIFKVMAERANKDLLEVVKLINDLHGKEITAKDLSEIEEKLDWVSLVHGAIHNFLTTNFGPPQPAKRSQHLLASAHFSGPLFL